MSNIEYLIINVSYLISSMKHAKPISILKISDIYICIYICPRKLQLPSPASCARSWPLQLPSLASSARSWTWVGNGRRRDSQLLPGIYLDARGALGIGFVRLLMVYSSYRGLQGILSGLTKSTDHPSRA